MQLRPYQKKYVKEVIKTGDLNVMVQLATGGGKTIIMGALCNYYLGKRKKILYIAHREELVLQPKDKFLAMFGIKAGLIKGKVKENENSMLQISTIQTFSRRVESISFIPDIIFIDEAHRSIAETYQLVINFYPNSKVIGMTATPSRLSGKGFTKLFDKFISLTSKKELEEKSYLLPARCFCYPLNHSKLSRVKVIAGDYNLRDLGKLMIQRAVVEDIVLSYNTHCPGKKMIVFAVNIDHSIRIKNRLTEEGYIAEHIDCNTKDRKEILDRFQYGATQILCNVSIGTEGLDIPSIEVVCLARPTESLPLYHQQIGRGSRPYNDLSEYIILDHANSFYKHGAPNKDHDWERYFKGKSVKEPKGYKITGKEKQIVEDIPMDIKGFLIEEVISSDTDDISVDAFYNDKTSPLTWKEVKDILNYLERNEYYFYLLAIAIQVYTGLELKQFYNKKYNELHSVINNSKEVIISQDLASIINRVMSSCNDKGIDFLFGEDHKPLEVMQQDIIESLVTMTGDKRIITEHTLIKTFANKYITTIHKLNNEDSKEEYLGWITDYLGHNDIELTKEYAGIN